MMMNNLSQKSKLLASKIRKNSNELKEITHRLVDARNKLLSKCNHEYVIQLNPYNRGTYSYDFDNWEAETRQCMVCGMMEWGKPEGNGSHTKFEYLATYQKRVQISSYDKRDGVTKMKHKHFIEYPLSEVIEYCETFGID
jgi:hypothetical protein